MKFFNRFPAKKNHDKSEVDKKDQVGRAAQPRKDDSSPVHGIYRMYHLASLPVRGSKLKPDTIRKIIMREKKTLKEVNFKLTERKIVAQSMTGDILDEFEYASIMNLITMDNHYMDYFLLGYKDAATGVEKCLVLKSMSSKETGEFQRKVTELMQAKTAISDIHRIETEVEQKKVTQQLAARRPAPLSSQSSASDDSASSKLDEQSTINVAEHTVYFDKESEYVSKELGEYSTYKLNESQSRDVSVLYESPYQEFSTNDNEIIYVYMKHLPRTNNPVAQHQFGQFNY